MATVCGRTEGLGPVGTTQRWGWREVLAAPAGQGEPSPETRGVLGLPPRREHSGHREVMGGWGQACSQSQWAAPSPGQLAQPGLHP